ncbi:MULTISPECIES: flagellar basal body L-ring protein FlgH [unclassified Duganella]|uniref:flagellar basal body L-ring protein FlgH n=1 Tax=unclassified Duganella TaxID=2636909 RepID=UPI000874708B|nr:MULTISPECIES: flagellar basal body L-ring protein FlgH [unclassified Duganella]OEZ54743.1 flagellar L-ring protein precursor [Duganella sp. HH105]OEZ96669.1 flagellar L-ring protein precursor [Duganella sp. HH101]
MRFTFLLMLAALGCAGGAQATSLYQPATYQSFTSDLRPRRVGDLITVMVYESASASSTANTSAGRDAGVGMDIHTPGKGYNAGVKANNQLDGRGRTAREGRVLAQITVAIREITEQGDLVIAGEQLLEVNNEKQQIRVEGRIRPQDVSDANVVLSTRIAGAKISYVGQGDLADVQHPAWWQRFLTLFGL